VKAAVVNGWDVRPTLERIVACSSGRLVGYRLITAPGPGPGPANSSERGASSWRPGHPVVVRTAACGTRLGGGPPHDGRFTKLVSAPEHSEDTPPRHILRLTSLRAHHGVPSSVYVRPCITAPHPSTSSGSAFTIKTGSDLVIGPRCWSPCVSQPAETSSATFLWRANHSSVDSRPGSPRALGRSEKAVSS
jgi:hypothetical protein